MNKAQELFSYRGKLYPDYIRRGNAARHIIPVAQHFCNGRGLDIGGTSEWHFPGAMIINPAENDFDHLYYPEHPQGYDYIFSSHCLEHIPNYVEALSVWKKSLRQYGQLFLYLPHPDMEYWQPQNCRKHLHLFQPEHIVKVMEELGFIDIVHSGRDGYWSFFVTGVNP